jgi:hypothetical protein
VSALFTKICYDEIMKKIFLCILLSLIWCNAGFTEIDDVYYCEMDKSVKTTDKEVIQIKKQKFKFKREQNILKFGSDGFFANIDMMVLKNSGEYFWGGDDWSRFIYTDGKFVFSNLYNVNLDNKDPSHQIRSIVATCDVF